MRRIALVGDYSPAVTAHQAIPIALARAREELAADLAWEWVHTTTIVDPAHDLAEFDGVWVVPASPYANMDGALGVIRWVRETRRPFLGTCGGFQHALIEIARDLGGMREADHAETNPGGSELVVTRLACSLAGQTGRIHFAPGSRLRAIYGRDEATEGYQCNYGPNSAHRAALEWAGLRFTACDDAGEIRGGELPESVHPFFVGVLYQPERAALRGETPPLARAFVTAIVAG